jgi:hypothetical protein
MFFSHVAIYLPLWRFTANKKGTATIISVHTTEVRASITVLEFYYLSLSENS